MSNVHILPDDVISKIAAGEVIERPASVVKELIENSLDAGSNSIELHIKGVGKNLIHIKDTGTGIAHDDIEKIFLRHSTSKISNVADLYSINSLGFRGEALYSIAAIADVTLRSKTANSDTGWQIHLRGGKKEQIRPINMGVGTEIEIRELFFNTPARKKFLKSNSTELNQILTIFIPYTILHYNRGFLLTHNDRTLLDLGATNNITSRICKVLNLKEKHLITSQQTIPEKNITTKLYLGDINIQRARKDMQFIFVNNRPVANRAINFNINQAYRRLMPRETYPFFLVNLTVPKEDVDVNAHPTKKEVKIKDEYSITSLLRALCEKTIMSGSAAKQIKEIPVTEFSLQEDAPGEYSGFASVTRPAPTPLEETTKQYVLGDAVFVPTNIVKEENIFIKPANTLKNNLSTAAYIGAFMKKYLLFQTKNSLLIIDQHAAQERITYKQLINQIAAGKVEVQHLLAPILIKPSPQEMLVWEVIKDKLEDLGLSTTLWDNETLALHTHPNLIPNPKIAIGNLLAGEELRRFDTETLARRACRNSLMTGYEFDAQQANYLRNQLLKCDTPFTCPHGRPTVIEMEEKILNKQFLR
ncbi:MAG: DNA mismatch repair endonuclease MutL [Candidatus Omnitrophota bacterium]|nr:DNA mismatch repair endonuclease MutL [Candidatus Omnitrophota bacterium]